MAHKAEEMPGTGHLEPGYKDLPDKVREAVGNRHRYRRAWRHPAFNETEVVAGPYETSSPVKDISIDREQGVARYRVNRPGNQELFVIKAEEDLETALVFDQWKRIDEEGNEEVLRNQAWLYHEGETWYLDREDEDYYFVPANNPEITDSWDTVKEALGAHVDELAR